MELIYLCKIMAAKRIKAFNVLLKELNNLEKTEFSPAKTQVDLFNFQEKFNKEDLIQGNGNGNSNVAFIQKMYACTIKNTKERNEFIESCDNYKPQTGLDSLISEISPLINESHLETLFNPQELSNPALLISKLMDPNNMQMKMLTEQFRPIIESKIKSGELDPSKITEELSKLF